MTNVSIPLPRTYIGAGYYAVSSSPFFVDYMLGGLDEVLLFNRALTGSEIHSIYAAGSAGLVRVPEFIGAGPFASGQFPLNLRGQTGKSFTIYGSPDFTTWTRLGTASNPNGAVQFIDSSATNAQGFYRASQP
jgi:hypothetical protein